MKKIKNKIIYIIAGMLMVSCTDSSILEYSPKGTLTPEQLSSSEAADKLVTAAYASLGNDDRRLALTNMWMYGGVRADDAYKGGGGVSNRIQWHLFETHSNITSDLSYLDDSWKAIYEGVARANEALRRMEDLSESEYPEKTIRQAEMRFIRAHFYFLLKTLFNRIPYIDETIPEDSLRTVSNREYSNNELWNKIAADFQFAMDNLPDDQDQVGRASATAAAAYLAKVRLYQAYEKNDHHEVVDINTDRLDDVIRLTNYVIDSGKHDLADDFGDNFLVEFENGPESVFAIQHSVDDGTPNGRTNLATSMNYNMAPEYGCCDFNKPSQTLVDAFKTGNGLPMFDTYNDNVMQDSIDFKNNTVDPRLDHTVGIPTHPFKYKSDFIMQDGWNRVPEVYGQYVTMKEIVSPDSPSFREVGPYYGSGLNVDVIRYADVLLWKAEALIELGRQDEALPLINQIRERAGNSTDRLTYEDGTPNSNYNIEIYKPGDNITWTQENAREALRWERRLEFAMEGKRFFDLVRWGIAAETINSYMDIESSRRAAYLEKGHFTEGKNEYFPIPQNQITLSEGTYVQNAGW